jgi:integrase
MARAGRKDRGLFTLPDSNGKLWWHVRLTHEGRDRKFGSFPTKTSAREFYEKAKKEQKEGIFFPERYQRGGYALFKDVVDSHLDAFTGRSLRDEKRYKKMWLALFPGARLNVLTPAAIEQARAQLLKGRAVGTINRYMQFLRRVLNKAVRDELLASNPVCRLKMFKEPEGKTRFLSVEEEAALCKTLGAPYAAWVRFAVLTGLRQLEQFTLRWEHVDLEHGVLTLPTTKAGGVQYVRLNEEAKGLLRGFDSWQRSSWVFPSENPATHTDPRNFYRRHYLPTMKKMGLTGATWHTLRHTFASRLAMMGTTEGTIASLLRHSGTSLVRRYAHLSPSYLQEAVEKVSAFGKVTTPEPVKVGVSERDRTEAAESVSAGPTVSKTGTVSGEGEGR